MSVQNDYIHLPATAGLSETTSRARLTWTTILTIAAVGASLALSCVTPFAALAVALAGTVGLRQSLRAVAIVWLANQFVGFVFFHFPLTANAFLWGVVMGIAAFLTTIVAAIVTKYASSSTLILRLAVPLLASFAVYELILLVAAIFLGSLETFRPSIVAQLAWINAASFLGMIVLNELAAAIGKRWVGKMPRLARSY
ncbi:MAG TPA: hypothetical protein VE031_00990 [Chthoniobacterales bacterium]|nr:hypothetical protein [Chthoniobacterales bacterium]